MAEDLGSTFTQSVDLLRQAKGEEALAPLRALLTNLPHDTSVLTNAGLAAAQSKNWGLALSYLREAQEKGSPHSQTGQAVDFVIRQLPVKEIPHQVEFWEWFRAAFLRGLPLGLLLALGAVVVLLVGLLALRYVNDRKKALLDEEPLPRVGGLHVLSSLLLVGWTVLCLAKLVDLGEIRAVILSEKVAARSAADAEAPALFDLYSGLEVVVERESGNWAQVRYPGGPIGWIETKDLRVFKAGYYN